MKRCDLHLHTTKSDGIYSPRELVYFLYSKGIKLISITDHDSIEAIEESSIECEKLGMELIPGIELSADHNGEEVHVLGYFIDTKSNALSDYLTIFREARKERFLKMVEKLYSLGVDVKVDISGFEDEKSIGRPHLAREMVKQGYVSSMEEAFAKYLGDQGPAYVEKFKISVKEAIDIIHESGGVAVLAHPGLLKKMEDVINLSILSGIDGIEVFHPKNPKYVEEQLYEVAFKNNLIITGGTDFHGDPESSEYINWFELYCSIEDKKIRVVLK